MVTCEVETRRTLGDASVSVGICEHPASVLIVDVTGAEQGCVCEAHAAEFERIGGWERQGAC